MTSSYDTFKKRITAKLHTTGFDMSTAEKITDNIINKVRFGVGPGKWMKKFTYGTGSETASRYTTLNDFLKALSDSNLGIDQYDINGMLKEFRTMSVIEAVNSFVLQFTKGDLVARRRAFANSFTTPVSNSSSAIAVSTVQNANTIQAKVKSSLAELRAKLTGAMAPWNIVKSIFAMFGAAFSFATDNEVMIGVFPLGGLGIDSPTSITYIEVAHSNKEVKFRAVGSIFLAHQVGGSDAVKISGKLTGPLRMYWLMGLWILSLLSQGYLELFDFDDDIVSLSERFLRDGNGPVSQLKKVNDVVTEKPSYEKHITFPVITTHEIIPSCYIETFSFEEGIDRDKDVITYDLLLRTYVEPEEFLSNNERTMIRATRPTKTAQVINYATNFIFRTLKAAKEYVNVDTISWKTDNYYDVDPLDMGFVFGLALAGQAL